MKTTLKGMRKIIIKGELPDLNTYINAERGNRYAGANIKKEATEMVQWSVNGQQSIVGQIIVKFTWYTKNERKDPDNVAFAKKFILDGLVRSGVLIDDTRKFIKGFMDEFDIDEANPRVEIEFIRHETH